MGNSFYSKLKEKDDFFKEGSHEEYWWQYPDDWKESVMNMFNKELEQIQHNTTKSYIILPKKIIYGRYYLDVYGMFNQDINGINDLRAEVYGDFVQRCVNSIKTKTDRPFFLSLIDFEKNEYPLLPHYITSHSHSNDYHLTKFALCINYVL